MQDLRGLKRGIEQREVQVLSIYARSQHTFSVPHISLPLVALARAHQPFRMLGDGQEESWVF